VQCQEPRHLAHFSTTFLLCVSLDLPLPPPVLLRPLVLLLQNPGNKFAKVNSLQNATYKRLVELTFEKFHQGARFEQFVIFHLEINRARLVSDCVVFGIDERQ